MAKKKNKPFGRKAIKRARKTLKKPPWAALLGAIAGVMSSIFANENVRGLAGDIIAAGVMRARGALRLEDHRDEFGVQLGGGERKNKKAANVDQARA